MGKSNKPECIELHTANKLGVGMETSTRERRNVSLKLGN